MNLFRKCHDARNLDATVSALPAAKDHRSPDFTQKVAGYGHGIGFGNYIRPFQSCTFDINSIDVWYAFVAKQCGAPNRYVERLRAKIGSGLREIRGDMRGKIDMAKTISISINFPK